MHKIKIHKIRIHFNHLKREKKNRSVRDNRHKIKSAPEDSLHYTVNLVGHCQHQFRGQ